MAELNLLVHIGAGKTGSTSIQRTFLQNTASLEAQQTRYLGLMGEGFIDADYTWQRPDGWLEFLNLQEQAAEQLLTCFKYGLNKLQDAGYKRAIWSNESLFNHSGLIIPTLEALSKENVKIQGLVYIRRHDAWARSAYLQWGIKHKAYKGKIKTFKEWSKDQNFSYMQRLKPWLNAKRLELVVRNFDGIEDVVRDFLKFCGLDWTTFVTERANESPNDLALALWAIFNGQFDEEVLPKNLMPILAQANIISSTAVDVDLEKLMPVPEDLQAIRENHKKDRNKLNKIFRQTGQASMPTTDLQAKPFLISQNQINAALLKMIKVQNDKMRHLEEKLNGILSQNNK